MLVFGGVYLLQRIPIRRNKMLHSNKSIETRPYPDLIQVLPGAQNFDIPGQNDELMKKLAIRGGKFVA